MVKPRILFCFVLQGIAEIVGQSDLNDYEMIEITHPDLLLVKGAREGVVLEACKDLSYLHSLYVISSVTGKWHILCLLYFVQC